MGAPDSSLEIQALKMQGLENAGLETHGATHPQASVPSRRIIPGIACSIVTFSAFAGTSQRPAG
jgi:hypothetical protein